MNKRYVFIILLAVLVTTLLTGCSQPEEIRQGVHPVQCGNVDEATTLNKSDVLHDNCTENRVLENSDYIDVKTEHAHILALSQLNSKEHLISCTEAEGLFVTSESHCSIGNGYCICGYEVSLILQDKPEVELVKIRTPKSRLC